MHCSISCPPKPKMLGEIRQRSLERVQAKLAKRARSEFTWDYRFSYERAKLAVWEGAPRRSLRSCINSAEIAIKNGDADRMLQVVQSDGNGPFHRLTQITQNGKRYLSFTNAKRTASWSRSNNHAPPYSTSHN